jgi:hypothetical protein
MDWVQASQFLASLIGIAGQVAKQRGAEEGIAALKAATSLIRAIERGDVSDVDPEASRAELDKLVDALVANDSEADRALAKKFAEQDDIDTGKGKKIR